MLYSCSSSKPMYVLWNVDRSDIPLSFLLISRDISAWIETGIVHAIIFDRTFTRDRQGQP